MASDSTRRSVPDLPRSWKAESSPLILEIKQLEDLVDSLDLMYAGLRDLDDIFRLTEAKLDLALMLLHHSDTSAPKERASVAAKHARDALLLTDSIQKANISLDQKDEIIGSEDMANIRDKLQRLVLFGGAALFDIGDVAASRSRKVAAALRKALLKYTAGQHQLTGDKIIRDDHLAEYEIKEGEEDILLSDRITLPLSQAVLLIEEEILPAVLSRLEENPGNPELIKQRDRLLEQAADYKTAKFFPRARPATLEKDLFTASLAGYTAEGEVLVTIDLQSIQSSGNTYDHLIEHLKIEIVRDCVGAGVSQDLDDQIQHTRTPEAGRRFSMTEALNKLDISNVYGELSLQFPFLRRIEDRQDLKLLADLAAQGRKTDLRKLIAAMAKEDRNLLSTATKRLSRETGD